MAVELGLALSQLIVAVAGYALLYAVGLAQLRRTDVRLLGLSYLLGWALLGVLLSLVLIGGVGPTVPTVLVVVAIEVAVCAYLGRRVSRVEAPPPTSSHPLALVAAASGTALIAVVVLAGAAVAAATEWNAASEFDAFWFLIPRAETIYYAHGLDVALWGSLPEPGRPPLQSVMDAMTFHFTGGVHPSLLVTQRTLLGIAFLLGLVTLLVRFVPRWLALPTVAALGTAPWFWSRLGSPMSDLTVTYLIATGALACMIWLRDRRGHWLAIALVLLAAASLTKFEGQIFAALLVVTVLIAGFAHHRRAALPAASLVLAPLVYVPWRLWISHHGLPTGMLTFRLSDAFDSSYLAGRGDRLTYAVREMRRTGVRLVAATLGGWHTTGLGGWTLAIPGLAGLVVAVRRVPLLAAATVTWLALAFFSLAATYWIARPEIAHYMNLTVRRVEPTIVAASIVLVTLLLGLSLRSAERRAFDGVVSRTAYSRFGWLLPAAAVVAVLAIADTRPRVSRTGAVDVGAMSRELAAQFRIELSVANYDYPIRAECIGETPDGLDFACQLATVGPVGLPPKVLTWKRTVTCEPKATVQRCVTNEGEALS